MWNNSNSNGISRSTQRLLDHKDNIIQDQKSSIDALRQEVQAKQIHIERLEEQVERLSINLLRVECDRVPLPEASKTNNSSPPDTDPDSRHSRPNSLSLVNHQKTEMHPAKERRHTPPRKPRPTPSPQPSPPPPQPTQHPHSNGGTIMKRGAISAEPRTTQVPQAMQRIAKSEKCKEFLRKALLGNDFLKHLEIRQIDEVVECMYRLTHQTNDVIIKESTSGTTVYVIQDGEVVVTKGGCVCRSLGAGGVFGELAILYGCLRSATVEAKVPCVLWAIDRGTFQNIMMLAAEEKHSRNFDFIKSVPIFKGLDLDTLHRLAGVLEEHHYEDGEVILREGTPGDTFYIITRGRVRVTKGESERNRTSSRPFTMRYLGRGHYFGERSLETDDARSANVISDYNDGVDCLCLDREAYNKLIRNSGIVDEPYSDERRKMSVDIPADIRAIDLHRLRVITTIGVGGFGRVELVQPTTDYRVSYVLKRMAKCAVTASRQQAHILNEKRILMDTRHYCIAKLYRTFRDDKFVYMLMEAYLGGELTFWLRQKGSFDNGSSQFYIACVVEALGYLHSRGIIYRDLKPENLVLDCRGYLKLVDFGLAKTIGSSGRTYTFCGTPEYVSPEILLNKGHDLASDMWSLGILMFEIITGIPPFTGYDPMDIYKKVLKGINTVHFPKKVTKHGQSLIKKLCRTTPSERIGYNRNGIKDIMKHKWFDGFHWKMLRKGELKAPILPAIEGPVDVQYFETSSCRHSDEKIAKENSGWDIEF